MPPTAKRKPTRAKPSAKRSTTGGPTFPEALAALLRSRKVRVPQAWPTRRHRPTPHSHRRMSSSSASWATRSFAGTPSRSPDTPLGRPNRAREAWEASPLIAELRRRQLKEPDPPVRVVGASVSLAKPLSEWSDREIVRAAGEWSRMGQASSGSEGSGCPRARSKRSGTRSIPTVPVRCFGAGPSTDHASSFCWGPSTRRHSRTFGSRSRVVVRARRRRRSA